MLIPASKSIKWVYCLTLVAAIFPSAMIGASSWVALATGGGLFSFGVISFLVWTAAFGYRIMLVVRHPSTLDAYVGSKPLLVLRRIGIVLMVVGIVGAIAQLFAVQIMGALFKNAGSNGIGLFVVRMYAYFVATGGLLGLGIFELSRLLGFERTLRDAV